MTINEWLKFATNKLQNAAVPSARIDSLILLEDATNLDRSYLLAHPDNPLDSKFLNALNKKLERRQKFEPLAYIRGHIEFYGLNFKVNPNVLIPRSESESFINLLTGLNPVSEQVLIDVGTGSGAIAISAATKFPALKIYATDISQKALNLAKQNTKTNKATIKFIKANLLDLDIEPVDFVLANLPYVPKEAYPWTILEAENEEILSKSNTARGGITKVASTSDKRVAAKINHSIGLKFRPGTSFKCEVSPDVIYEPKQAIFARTNGLELIIKLVNQASKKLKVGGYLLLESLAEQQPKIKDLANQNGFEFVSSEYLVQAFKKTP